MENINTARLSEANTSVYTPLREAEVVFPILCLRNFNAITILLFYTFILLNNLIVAEKSEIVRKFVRTIESEIRTQRARKYNNLS